MRERLALGSGMLPAGAVCIRRLDRKVFEIAENLSSSLNGIDEILQVSAP